MYLAKLFYRNKLFLLIVPAVSTLPRVDAIAEPYVNILLMVIWSRVYLANEK
jgi:hypothetical protein